MKRFALSLLIAFIWVLSARADGVSVTVNEPRAFGYFIGDTLVREVIVDVPAGVRLRTEALPQPGSRDYWLDLTDVTVASASGGNETRIKLTYQIFYSALEPKLVRIPGFKLYFEGSDLAPAAVPKEADKSNGEKPANEPESADERATLGVPPLDVIVSPLREIIPEKNNDPAAAPLRPDAVAELLGTGRARTALLASVLAGLAALTALAYHYAWFPFGARKSRPFTRAARQLNALSKIDEGDVERYKHELLILHRAFDEVYGRRLLSSDVGDFLKSRHEFGDLAGSVTRFFEASRLTFFSGKPSAAQQILPPDSVTGLAYELALHERRAA